VRDEGLVDYGGRQARRFTATDGSATYIVDAATFDPIEWETRGTDGGTRLRFTAYEKLPATPESLALTDLEAQHLGARVVDDPQEYEAAVSRLYPHG
jgi:hypothetical protein